MKPLAVVTVLVGCLAVANPICAGRASFRIVPDKFDDSSIGKANQLTIKVGDEFAVKVVRIKEKDKQELIEFQITVKRKKVPAPIIRRGQLMNWATSEDLLNGTKVKQSGRDEEMSFTFRVAAKDVRKIHFIYSEAESSGERGYFFTFHLEDFLASK